MNPRQLPQATSPNPPPHPTEAISWVPFQQLVVHNSVPQCTQCSVPLAVTFVPLLDSIYCALPFGWLVGRGAKLLQPHPTTLLPPPHPMIGTSPHPASDGCTSNVPTPLSKVLLHPTTLLPSPHPMIGALQNVPPPLPSSHSLIQLEIQQEYR